MPAYPKLPSQKWLNPKQDSVFDPAAERIAKKALRGLTSFIAGSDPQEQVMSAAMPAPLVAAVKPHLIPALRKAGEKVVESVRTKGLAPRILGMHPKVPYDIYGDVLKLKEVPAPYTPAPQELINTLEFAQKRYPRLFGHVTDIADIDSLTKAQNPWGVVAGGQQGTGKFSALSFNPGVPDVSRSVGHELLHAADQIVDPNAGKKYAFFNTLPGGYAANSMEVRARNMGDKLVERMAIDKLRKTAVK